MNVFFHLRTFILNYSFIVILSDHNFCTLLKHNPLYNGNLWKWKKKIPERSRSVLGTFYCISNPDRLNQWFPKCAPRTFRIRDYFPVDPWIHFCNAYFEVYLFSNLRYNVLLKIIANSFKWRYVYFVLPLEYLIKEPPVTMKRETISLRKVKSCNVFLRMLLLRTSIYLKSVLRYKCLILDT